MTPAIGPYGIVRRLAVGGMAEVFLAQRPGMEQDVVVLKRVRERHAAAPHYLRMFRDEIRIAAELSHPNIPRLLDYAIAGDAPYYTMEYVRGVTVARLRRLAAEFGTNVPHAVALAIVHGAAEALHHAHEQVDAEGISRGIVHRDVSPTNVLLSLDGTAKVIDFGVAKASRRESETTERLLKGRIGYMSPEQCTGAPIDRRSDVFALGILLYELTTGHRAYRGTDYRILSLTATKDVEPPSVRVPMYPTELEGIVLRAMKRDPRARTQTAAALATELAAYARSRELDLGPRAPQRFVVSLLRRHVATRRPRPQPPAPDPHRTIVDPIRT